MTQSEINEVLVQKAKEGKIVVRLKGGDPYVFGRGGEEAEVLVAEGIEFEIVPGITSAIAVPAYAGIPITHRESTSMVTFITGHEDPTKEESGLDWETLAKFEGTLVIFMGVKMLRRNTEELMKHGKNPKTPVAVIERGTRPDQRVTVGTLENIANLAEERKVKAPAITVVGDVVNLHKILGEQHTGDGLLTQSKGSGNTGEEKEEAKMPVLAIMRPESYRERSESLARDYGFEPIYVPMIKLEGMKDEGFEPFVQRVLAGTSDYVVFTSANGITFTLDKLSEIEKENFITALKKSRVIAIGPNTEKELIKIGVDNPFLPGDYSSEGIVEALCPEVKGKTVDLARSAFGAKVLIEGLEKCGATVYETHVYTLSIPEGAVQKKLIERTLAGEVDAFAFTSSMMVKGFMKHAEQLGAERTIKEILNRAIVGAIGTPTGNTLKKHGVKANVIPDEFTFEALLKAIKNRF